MEELGIVAELVKSVRGEEGEDGKDGENCREDYKEEGIVFILGCLCNISVAGYGGRLKARS